MKMWMFFNEHGDVPASHVSLPEICMQKISPLGESVAMVLFDLALGSLQS